MKSEDQVDVSEDKSSPIYEKGELRESSSDAEIGHGEVVEESTKRGLKARHAQMIALGGTIGELYLCQSLKHF